MKIETIRACSIWRALEIVGDVPVLLILERSFLGTHSFEAFVEQTSLPRSVVSNRLKKLVEADCLKKARENGSRRSFYRLTEKGLDLFPLALAMLGWQRQWEPSTRSFRVRLRHDDCGLDVTPVARCSVCSDDIDPRDVDWRAGPGIAQVAPIYSRRRRPTKNVTDRRETAALIDTVIALFGDRWSTLIVRALFTNLHRFDEILQDTLMAPNILSGRIIELIDRGIIQDFQYSSLPPRYEYRLTAKGRALYPVLLAMLQWGDRYYADDKGPPLLLTHRNCSQELDLKMACDKCGGDLKTTNLTYQLVNPSD